LFILRSIKVIIFYKSPKRSEEFILSSFKPVALDVDVACSLWLSQTPLSVSFHDPVACLQFFLLSFLSLLNIWETLLNPATGNVKAFTAMVIPNAHSSSRKNRANYFRFDSCRSISNPASHGTIFYHKTSKCFSRTTLETVCLRH